MKKKFALVTATAVTALLLFVGCGVNVTNISVPDAATLEKGDKNGDGAVVLTTCTVLFL